MKRVRAEMVVGLMMLLCISPSVQAQQGVATAANAAVPPLIQFSNVATDEGGNSLGGVVNITFSLYSAQQDGEPLWTETQNNVELDPTGHYSVQLGITKPNGVPTTLFTTGEARWLGVQIAEQAEQSRVLLLSVPYALKAGDAATIGGLPPSAFVLAAPGAAVAASAPATSAAEPADASPSTDVTGAGVADFIPLWTTTSNIADSVLFQLGTKIGIGTSTPATTLDVKGGSTIRGTLSLPSTGTATASKGFDSQPLTMTGSAFNSATNSATIETFQFQVEPVDSGSSSPSAAVSVLFGSGAEKPVETGLNIASNGQITFAQGQIFPGTGNGTVTSVAGGAGLAGGTITGSGTLSIANAGVTNTMLANPSLTVTAGADLTGGGLATLGGNVTLNLDTTKVPQLNAANTFTANQMVNGTLTASSFAGSGSGLTSVTAANSNELGGLASSAFPQLAANNTFSGTQTVNNTVTVNGTNSSGVLQVTNTTTSSSAAPGIVGTTQGTNASGVKGVASATTGDSNGVYGTSSSTTGIGVKGSSPNLGVYGQSSGASQEGQGLGSIAGVWGDTGGPSNEGYAGVLGTADDNAAGAFLSSPVNTSIPDGATLYAENDTASSTNANVFTAYAPNIGFGSLCTINVGGDLSCTGTVSGVAPVDGGSRNVALYAIEGPENWFEDAGSAQLSNGTAVVNLEQVFGQTVNTEMEYHVFLTPNGDCKGLYVSQKTPASFEVRELSGGTSSIAFDYRIMAKRKGYESIRLVDKTNQFGIQATQRRRMRHPVRPIATPQTSTVTPQSPLRAVAQPLAAHPR
jgi:hypothetical protein